MQRLKSVFRDVGGLHARINLAAANSSVVRIALIPRSRRESVAGVLNALVDDPVQKTPWAAALADRALSKDTLVTQSATFDFVETHNALLVYPIPFHGPAVEYMEVSSLQDSWDHVASCHLHVYLSTGAAAPSPSEYPSLEVVDLQGPLPAPSSPIRFEGEFIEVSSRRALEGNALLQAAPQNVSQYTELVDASRIGFLRAQLTERPDAVHAALRRSIVASCQRQIAELPQTLQVDSAPRERWSKQAHHELQSELLPAVRSTLAGDLAWWKLYAHSDDVDSELMTLIVDRGLQHSQAALNYLEGEIGAAKHADFVVESTLPVDAAAPAITWLYNAAHTAVLSALVIQVPTVLLAIVGVVADGFTWYQMGALALLGIVAGLRAMQTAWLRASAQFTKVIEEVMVQAITKGEERLFNYGEKAVLEQAARRQAMQEALDSVTIAEPKRI